MNRTVALPGSMTWMGIRLSSGSRRPQSPKGPSSALTQSVFCSYGPVVVEWPGMLCAWSSQYPHRPIPPDQSRSVYRSHFQMVCVGYPLCLPRLLRGGECGASGGLLLCPQDEGHGTAETFPIDDLGVQVLA